MTNETQQVSVIPDPKAPIVLGVTKAALTKLKKKWGKVPDASTEEGYNFILDAKRELVPLRTGVEKEATLQKESAQAHIKKINAAKNSIVETIQAIEKPLYDERQRVDDERAAEKLRAEKAEENRIAEIEGKVEDIQALAEGLLGADLATLEDRLNQANAIVISDEEFMEFVEPASLSLGQVKTALGNAVELARQTAVQQAQLQEEQAAFGKQQAELKEQQDKLAAEQRAHEEQVAADKAAQEKREREEREAAEAKELEEREAAEAVVRAAELKARMPEDQKIRAYADALLEIEEPKITDDELINVICTARERLLEIRDYVIDNTQAG